MAAPSLAGWQSQILKGIDATDTPQNLTALNAWAQAEGGGATNNPFNTTQPMSGATPYNTLGGGSHVWNYPTPQAGIQATIQTLKGPVGNYGPILAALRAGNNPMAVAQAIAGSQWGTGSGVERVLGGQVPTSLNPATPNLAPMPPGQAALPGASPQLPQVNMPPAPKLPAPPDNSSTILSSIIGGGSLNDMTNALIKSSIDQSNAAALAPMPTPAAQAKSPTAMATTPNGTQVQFQGKPNERDVRAVQLAEHFIGTPYVWGGASPKTGFDCSGLIQYVWGKQGVDVPRTTYDQFQSGTPVAKKNLQPGDAVYFTGSDPKGNLPGHVGMYIGGGKFVEAPHTGADVRVSTLAGRSDYVGARTFT